MLQRYSVEPIIAFAVQQNLIIPQIKGLKACEETPSRRQAPSAGP
jgi:hypothetical protein